VEQDDIVIFEVVTDALDGVWWAGYNLISNAFSART
jgi:hypothetical protein